MWATVGAGLTFWSFGDIWWIAFYAKASDVPYPSVADVFWLASYPPMAYGLWRLISLRIGWQALGAAAWLDGVIAALGGSAIFAATLLAGPLAAAAQGEPMTFATNLAYPVGDLDPARLCARGPVRDGLASRSRHRPDRRGPALASVGRLRLPRPDHPRNL